DAEGAGDISDLTFLTEDDETSSAPNSRQLVAGSNITLDDSTPGQLSIASAAGGVSGSWTPIDTSGASLSFAAAAGTYYKIGDRVVAFGNVTYPATASGASSEIGNLP